MMDDLQIAMRRIDHEGTFTVLRNGKLLDVHVRKSNVFVRDTEGKIMYDEENKPLQLALDLHPLWLP